MGDAAAPNPRTSAHSWDSRTPQQPKADIYRHKLCHSARSPTDLLPMQVRSLHAVCVYCALAVWSCRPGSQSKTWHGACSSQASRGCKSNKTQRARADYPSLRTFGCEESARAFFSTKPVPGLCSKILYQSWQWVAGPIPATRFAFQACRFQLRSAGPRIQPSRRVRRVSRGSSTKSTTQAIETTWNAIATQKTA